MIADEEHFTVQGKLRPLVNLIGAVDYMQELLATPNFPPGMNAGTLGNPTIGRKGIPNQIFSSTIAYTTRLVWFV